MKSGQEIIAEIGATIASTLDVGEVMRTVARQVGEAFGVYSCDVHSYDPESDLLTYLAFWDLDQEAGDSLMVCDAHHKVSEQVTGLPFHPDLRPSFLPTVRDGKMVEVHRDDPDLPAAEAREMDRWSEKSTLDAPLVFDNRIIGVLGLVETRSCRRFTEAEKELFGQLSVLAAIAIQNAALFSRLEEQNRSLYSLLKAGRALTSSLELDETLTTMARSAAEALQTSGCVIYEHLPEGKALACRSVSGAVRAETMNVPLPLQARSGDRLAIERQEIVIERATDLSLPAAIRNEMQNDGELTHLHVPLIFEGRTLGAMVLIERSAEREFTASELELAGGLAEQAAAALYNARLYQALQRQAQTDGLTGLYNYRHFQSRLSEESARFRRYGTPLSMLMLDVDDFKRFNDEFGHQMGDKALISLANVLGRSLRSDIDVICRYGGEEFAVLLPNTRSEGSRGARKRHRHQRGSNDTAAGDSSPLREIVRSETGPSVAERLRRDIAEQSQKAGNTSLPRALTVSIGVSQMCEGASTPDQLVALADEALYVAKRLGKNRVEVLWPADVAV